MGILKALVTQKSKTELAKYYHEQHGYHCKKMDYYMKVARTTTSEGEKWYANQKFNEHYQAAQYWESKFQELFPEAQIS